MTRTLFVICSAFATAHASGQLPVTAYWETSTDQGGTWNGGAVTVPEGTVSALVRLRVGWDPANLPTPSINWYADCRFDGVVAGINGAGLNDTAGNFFAMNLSYWMPADLMTGQRQGDILKLDLASDTLPPGQGIGLGPNQWPGDPQQQPTRDNPVRIFQYELFFDGTPGQRDIYGVWLASVTGNPINFRVWIDEGTRVWATSLVNVPASVTVLPAPAALVLYGAGAVWCARARKR